MKIVLIFLIIICQIISSLATGESAAAAATATAPSASEWWRKEIIYQIYPRSFRDADGDGTGDIQGIIGKLDYLLSIGVKAIWLSPIYPSPMADFGYDISNHTDIDPIFGSLQDFDELLFECRRKGIYVIMDLVPNHTSDEHRWFIESRNDRSGRYGNYYVWADCQPPAGDEDGSRPSGVNNWLSNFGGSAWTYDPVRRQCYLHQFAKEQPDLNFSNPDVRAEMEEVVRFWVRRGVDGFRVDAIRHMFEDPLFRDEPIATGDKWRTDDAMDYFHLDHVYTTDYNETYSVMFAWRKILDDATAADGRRRLLIAEAYSPPEVIMRYYSYHGNRLADFPFNFRLILSSKLGQKFCNARCLHQEISDFLESLPAGECANWVLGNHDNNRMATRFPPADRFAVALNTLLLTLPGSPTCYYGDELGMADIEMEPDQMVDPLGRRFPEQSRDPARAPMLWDNSSTAGFSTNSSARPWLPVEPQYQLKCVATQEQKSNSILNSFKSVAQLRRQFDSASDSVKFLHSDERIFIFWRGDLDSGFVILLYISQHSESVAVHLQLDCKRQVMEFDGRRRQNLSLNSLAMEAGDAAIFRVENCKSYGKVKVEFGRDEL